MKAETACKHEDVEKAENGDHQCRNCGEYFCGNCGTLMTRLGACRKCSACGNTFGCS